MSGWRTGTFGAALLTAAALFVVAAAPAGAAVYCVDTSGGDCTNPGYTGAAGFQQALTDANATLLHDTVRLGPATYTAPLNDGFVYPGTTSSVAITGTGPGSTVIAMQTPPLPVNFTQYNGLRMFGVTGSSVSGLRVQMPVPADAAQANQQYRGLFLGSGVTVENVTVEDSGQQLNGFGLVITSGTVSVSAIDLTRTGSPTVTGLAPANNSASDLIVEDSVIGANTPIDYFNDMAGTLRVRRSTLRPGAPGPGLSVGSGSAVVESTLVDLTSFDSVGLAAANFNNATLPMSLTATNVTIVGGSGSSTGVRAIGDSSGDGEDATVTLGSSVIEGPATAIFVGADQDDVATVTAGYSNYDAGTVVVNNDLIPGGPTGTATLTPTDITNHDPGFLGASDFRLAPTSPLIDIGDPAAPPGGSLDLAGNPRALAGTPGCGPTPGRRDIGAFEFVPALLDCLAPNTLARAVRKVVRTRGRRGRARFTFSASETATFQCSLDGGPFRACTSPLTRRLRIGRHTLRVRARDAAGNTDATPAKARVRVKRIRRRR